MIRAIIFDMDGVLINSEKLKAEAWRRILKEYDIDKGNEWYKQRIGTSRMDLCKEAIKTFSLPIKPEALAEMKRAVYRGIMKTQTEPIYQTVKFLKAIPREKYRLALASSTNRETIKAQLGMIGVYQYFDVLVAGEEDVKNNKPFPDIYLTAAKKLYMNPEQCLVIEDSASGIESAVRAGMMCIAFKNPDSGKQDLSKASYIVEDFSTFNLEKFLKGI